MSGLPSTLLEELPRQRWFGAKGRPWRSATVLDRASWSLDEHTMALELMEVSFVEGGSETYTLLREGDRLDALVDPRVALDVLQKIRSGATLPTEQGGAVTFWHASALADSVDLSPRLLGAEQSNTSVRFGSAFVLKLFRRVQPGVHPDLEVTAFLTQRAAFPHTPALLGAIEYRPREGDSWALATLQGYVPSRGDAWRATLDRLAVALETGAVEEAVQPLSSLGEITARLHLALVSAEDDPAFAPRPIRIEDVDGWLHEIDRKSVV